jgi:NAD(P)-dependent dehydrogenase (short-subunit alcohol dehydrogenase family)
METKGTALITGASSGIGAIYADRLARRGYDVILVARNQSRLAAVAQRLRDETSRSVGTIAADLNDKADPARIEATLRTNANITLLVNNAGIGAAAPLLDSDVEKMDEMIRLNVGAPQPADLRRGARLCRARGRDHHQHRVDRGDLAGNAQRRLWRHESFRAGLQPVAAS